MLRHRSGRVMEVGSVHAMVPSTQRDDDSDSRGYGSFGRPNTSVRGRYECILGLTEVITKCIKECEM
jgi:hypothetical protein